MEIAFFHWYSGRFENVEYSCSSSSPLRFSGSLAMSRHSRLVYCSYSSNLRSICINLVSKSSLTLLIPLPLFISLSSSFISLTSCFSSLVRFNILLPSVYDIWLLPLTLAYSFCRSSFVWMDCWDTEADILRFPISR